MSLAIALAPEALVGAKRVRQMGTALAPDFPRRRYDPLHWPAGTEVWEVTGNLQDLRVDAFVAGHDRAEIVAALEARYPARHPLLTRIEAVELRHEWQDGRLVQPKPIQYVVHAHPLLDMAVATRNLDRSAGSKDVLHALAGPGSRVAALESLVRENGSVLMHREPAESLRTNSGFEESSIVVAPLTGTHYALVKFNPSKAKARRTRQDNLSARIARAEELGHAAAEMRTRIDALSQALIDELKANGSFLGYALPERQDSHLADDWEPVRYEHHAYHGAWSGRRYDTGTSARGQTRKCLARLYALTKIHEQFRGRRAYRRFPQWTAARAQYAKLPDGLDPERWGCWVGPLTTFWKAEMRARAPRARAVIKTDDKSLDRGPDGVSEGDDEGEDDNAEEA